MNKNKRTILFRADGGPSIGMGHFTRTLALAEMLNEHFHCIFATRQPTEYQIAEIEKICHGRIDLPEDDSHFEVFLNHLKGNEIVVLDNYYFTTEYQKAIKNKGCKLVCIDDMHDKHYVADVVINHALTDEKLFCIEEYTTLFLGLDYALIRNDFLKSFGYKRQKNTLLINIGGSDFNNLTTKIIEFLINENINKKYIVYVLTGNANINAALIKNICEKNNVQFLKDLSASQLSAFLEKVEYAILPASTILIEAMYKEVKILAGYYVENQTEFYKSLVKNKQVFPLGDLNNPINYKKIRHGLTSCSLNTTPVNNKHHKLLNIFLKL